MTLAKKEIRSSVPSYSRMCVEGVGGGWRGSRVVESSLLFFAG